MSYHAFDKSMPLMLAATLRSDLDNPISTIIVFFQKDIGSPSVGAKVDLLSLLAYVGWGH